jgi:hypothetical protein
VCTIDSFPGDQADAAIEGHRETGPEETVMTSFSDFVYSGLIGWEISWAKSGANKASRRDGSVGAVSMASGEAWYPTLSFKQA